jgi:hypothetical protein
MARTKKKASRKGKRNPQWTGAAGTEASWFGRALGHEKWPDSDFPYDVPGQVTGKYKGYLFRVYQRPRGVGFVKESWDWKDRHHLMLPYAPTKAQAVHEVKQRIDEYIKEAGVKNPKGGVMPWLAAYEPVTAADIQSEIRHQRDELRRDKAALKALGKRPTLQQMIVHGAPDELREDIAFREEEIASLQKQLERLKTGRAAAREAKPKPMQHVVVRRRGVERSKPNPSTRSISGGEFDALRTGQRVWITVSTVMGSGGEMEFEVGKSTYSKKYDVHNKRLFPVHAGKPQKTGAKWTLRKRASGLVSLAHGDMGTLIKGYRTNPGRTTSVRAKINPKAKRGRKSVKVSLRSVMAKASK